VRITTNQPDTESSPDPNPNPTTKQHAIVSIQLHIHIVTACGNIVTYVSREIHTRRPYCNVVQLSAGIVTLLLKGNSKLRIDALNELLCLIKSHTLQYIKVTIQMK